MATGLYGGVILAEAMESFNAIIAPISAMSFATDNEQLNVGDTVLVPYSLPNSSSNSFDYSTGYSSATTTLGVRPVQLTNVSFQKFVINDNDHAKLSNGAIQTFARTCGAKLAGDVIQSVFSNVITDANFALSASCTYGQLTSSLAIADLTLQADNANWTNEQRNMILSPSAWNTLIKNPSLNNAYSFGGSDVIQKGLPTNVMGFNTYKTTVSMPNSTKGIVLNPNAILVAFGQHKTPDIANPLVNFFASNLGGVTITMKEWYDPTHAQTNFVFECLHGSAKGDGSALYQMK